MNSDPRHRAHYHQLWIDKVRAELDNYCSLAELDQSLKMQALTNLLGWDLNDASVKRVCALSRSQLAFEFVKHDLVDPLPVVALRTLKTRGYPQRELTPSDWPACEAKVGYALSWCAYDILRSPQTRVMLLDDTTAKPWL